MRSSTSLCLDPSADSYLSATRLVAIAPNVPDAHIIAAGALPEVTILRLTPNTDAIDQITSALQQYPEITSLHIVSHGAPGIVDLGDTKLSLTTLPHYAQQLHQWSNLANLKQIILYGCRVALGDAGEELITKLHALTNTPIAASRTLTGSPAQGGNWQLETRTGDFAIQTAIAHKTLHTYPHTLSLILFAITEDDIVAEDLPYGPQTLTSSDSAFFDTQQADVVHDTWTQVGTDGSQTLYTIEWKFSSTKTLEQRFIDAVTAGEAVTWTVTSNSHGVQTYTGDWYFSNEATNFATGFGTSGSDFSYDDGVWGAANGTVDAGDGGSSTIEWGHANFNGSDRYDSLFLNGVDTPIPVNFKNLMYIGALDTIAPVVINVSSSTAAGTYRVGDSIDITIQFDEIVDVTGIPQLTLETGITDRTIDYTSGSGSDTLSFTYLVQSDDRSLDLDYLAITALSLNGGTIQDAAGNNAVLDLPTPGAAGSLADNTDIVVETEEESIGLVPQTNNLLTVDSMQSGLSVTQLSGAPGEIYEIVVVETETDGSINGINSEDANYLDEVLNNARVLFSTLPDSDISNLNPSRLLEVTEDSNLQFLLIRNGTLDSLLNNGIGNVFFALPDINGQSPISIVSSAAAQSVEVTFQPPGIDTPVILQMALTDDMPAIGTGLQGSPEGEMIDLRTETGELTVNVEVYREAALDNLVGFYQVENDQGHVFDQFGNLLSPGDVGYTAAALGQNVAELNISGENNKVLTSTATIMAGRLLATFIIVDGTIEQLLDSDMTNDPAIYFNHLGANSDGQDHVRLLGDNTFGYEDMTGGGDMDYDDIIARVSFGQ